MPPVPPVVAFLLAQVAAQSVQLAFHAGNAPPGQPVGKYEKNRNKAAHHDGHDRALCRGTVVARDTLGLGEKITLLADSTQRA